MKACRAIVALGVFRVCHGEQLHNGPFQIDPVRLGEDAVSFRNPTGWRLPAFFPRAGSFNQGERLSIQLKSRQSHELWWTFPLFAMIISYATFPMVSQNFHSLVLWVSQDSWFADTPEKTNLLSNVVTQVVNGPVVTSISVLFATLISVTVSNLHARQHDVQSSLINEIEALRGLESLMLSPLCSIYLTAIEINEITAKIDSLRTVVTAESSSDSNDESTRPKRQRNPHDYIGRASSPLLALCDEIEVACIVKSKQRKDAQPLLSKIRDLVTTVRTERKNRWIAITSMHFPTVHYLTLTLLVLSILVSFLVTTDEAEFIFLQGLQVRMLWSILVTCFSSLAVACADLADAFSGAYAVATDFP